MADEQEAQDENTALIDSHLNRSDSLRSSNSTSTHSLDPSSDSEMDSAEDELDAQSTDRIGSHPSLREETESAEQQMRILIQDILSIIENLQINSANETKLVTKLNVIAELLEQAEANFCRERTASMRRENHSIGMLFRIVDDNDDFYGVLEDRLVHSVGEDASHGFTDRVRAALARVLLALVPSSHRFITNMLYEEEALDKMCKYATESEPPLRCYATGIMSVALRDRSIADTVVNREIAIEFLKRARLYASKLEERRQALDYMHENLQRHTKGENIRQKRHNTASSQPSSTSYSQHVGSKRRHSGEREREHAPSPIPIPTSTDRMTSETNEVSNVSITNHEGPDEGPTNEAQVPDPEPSERIVTDSNAEVLNAPTVEANDAHHEEDVKRLVMLELLYTLDCLGCMGEYLELFAPALKEDIVGTIITFLHSKNLTVLSHTLKLTSHFLAHKKFSLTLVEAGGILLMVSSMQVQQEYGQFAVLDRSLSMCLHGFASSTAVMERIIAIDRDLTLVKLAFDLLSSPNDRARQNAVVYFGLSIVFKSIMEFFEKHNGLYTLLNIIRTGNTMQKSSTQRQLSHDACLCLRQYLRVHLSLLTHRLRRKLSEQQHQLKGPTSTTQSTSAATIGYPSVLTTPSATVRLPARVPKLSSSKAIDIDDKIHEQNLIFFEKYRLSVTSTSQNSNVLWWSHGRVNGELWSPAAKVVHLRGILVMLEVASVTSTIVNTHCEQRSEEDATSVIRGWMVERTQFCLEALRILTLVVPLLVNEVCSTEVIVPFNFWRDNLEETSSIVSNEAHDAVSPLNNISSADSSRKLGISILLEIAMSTNPRDSDLVRDVLRVLCNCVSPPHAEECWQHPHKDLRQYTMAAWSTRNNGDDSHLYRQNLIQSQPNADKNSFTCCGFARDDKILRPVRRMARENNAIKVCIQLLRYKRSVKNADIIRLLATRTLLGLARDRHITQILEKMQLGQLLSDLIRTEPVLEENTDVHVRFREAALDLISCVTERAPTTVITEATDPTVRKIGKANIVAETKITYDEMELLRLIQDHLATVGLDKVAEALAKEANLPLPRSPSKRKKRGWESTQSSKSNSKHQDLPYSRTRFSDRLRSGAEDTKESSQAVAHRRNRNATLEHSTENFGVDKGADIARTSKRLKISAVHESGAQQKIKAHLEGNTRAQRSESSHSGEAGRKRHCHSQKRKHIRSAFHSSSYFDKQDRQARKARRLAPPRTKSQLDNIITHYLREQHRQCVNPVTTVPPFKLFGTNATHSCPEPQSLYMPPRILYNSMCSHGNITTSILLRDRIGVRYGVRAFSDPYADAGVNRYIYSRYRPYQDLYHSPMYYDIISAQFYSTKAEEQNLLLGTREGVVHLVNAESTQLVKEWEAHSRWSRVIDLETNIHTPAGSQRTCVVTGAIGSGLAEIALWNINNREEDMIQWRRIGVRCPKYNHFGDHLVALDVTNTEDHDRPGNTGLSTRGNRPRGALIVDVLSGQVISSLKDVNRSNDYGLDTNACYSQDDTKILTDGMLWDVRSPKTAVHKFDKLSNAGNGFFHPNGNEVVINAAVWDLRTYRLLRVVPALDKSQASFSPQGSVLFVYYPLKSLGGDYDDLKRRRSKLRTWFRVLDARDYKEISTVELERDIVDLRVDPLGNFLSVVEGFSAKEGASIKRNNSCILYEIGRRRAAEADSDVEDHSEDEDTTDSMDYESDTEEDAEEDSEDFEEYSLSPSDYDADDHYEVILEGDELEADDSDEANEDDQLDHQHHLLSSREVRALSQLPSDMSDYQVPHSFSSEEENEDDDSPW
uniref:Uncharacterized protein AlNc14C3G376 n=1 Tax=Albugo laibachii Nc14 TaxID=890382 RepID=F0VZP7_9STRA|nr:conserved hypothetical protein [Albugo laibachii Nc14]|eukprot:CCA14268.1 conserved hypothetical protein [Albugo laibachii Nc14]